MGVAINWDNPKTLNEKLQWLKIYWRDPLATVCEDKYAVRDYVRDTIGEQYLNTLIGVYDTIDEIDINSLPDKFVLKATHGSSMNIICSDKSKMNWGNEKKN